MAYSDDEILAKLQATRDGLIDTRLKIIAKPKPSYNIDGQEVKWAEYLKQLDTSIATLNAEIDNMNGPFEEVTVAYSGP